MPESIVRIVPPEAAGQRLDAWLAAQPELGMTRSAIQQLLAQGNILRDGKLPKKNDRLRGGAQITVAIPTPTAPDICPQEIPLEIVYEDAELLVVNKPKGMVVHPAPGHPDGTLVNALLWHCAGQLSGINGVIRPGIVHRIDRDTSGLLIVAKTDRAHLGLAAQIAEHSFTREYEAVVCGRFREASGTIDAPIGRDPRNRQKMCVTQQNSRRAVTHYCVLTQYARFAHICCRLETGRTHQIRVHMRHLGHPLYGDGVYGRAITGVEGQCLHARKIGFVHPISGEQLWFESPLPPYFTQILQRIAAQSS